jgi:hypothetical protein
MAVRFRHILIVMTVIAVAGAGLVALVVWSLFSAIDNVGHFTEAPEDLKTARIIAGHDLVLKEEIFKLKTQGFLSIVLESITEIDEAKKQQKIQSESLKKVIGFETGVFDASKNEIILAGKFGAEIMDRSGNLKREILYDLTVKKLKIGWFETTTYNQGFGDLKIVDTDRDGSYEFLGYGGLDGLAIFDNTGKGLWRYGGSDLDISDVLDKEKREKASKRNPSIRAAASGDLDGDGIEEIILTNLNDQMIALDNKGNEKWRQADDIPGTKLWTVDLDGDGKTEIVELFYRRPRIKDSNGKLIKQTEVGDKNCDAIFVTEDGKKKKLNFLGFDGNKMSVVDEDNKLVLRGDAPLSEVKNDKKMSRAALAPKDPKDNETVEMPVLGSSYEDGDEKVHDAKAVKARLKNNEQEYLAVVADYILLDRSMFYIYSAEGKLVYAELLPESSNIILALPGENGGIDQILVGGTHTVWRYSLK